MPINTKKFIESQLRIKDKKAQLIPFRLNEAQNKLYEVIKSRHRQGKPARIIILKARQMGFSTLVEGIFYKITSTRPNINSGIVTHSIEATNNLFTMSKRFYDNEDEELRPKLKASNAKMLMFDFDDGESAIKCMTAGNGTIGRSDTFQNLHLSEYAFWQGEKAQTLSGLMQAVPNEPSTVVIIESTANGYDAFKDMWDKACAGENDFVPVFCAWWEHAEYSMSYSGFALTDEEKRLKSSYCLSDGQLEWRRWCIKNNCAGNLDMFRQEYPSCPEEAFLMSGRPVFDNDIIIGRITELERKYTAKPYRSGKFSFNWHDAEHSDYIEDDSIKLVKSGGDIRLYELPQSGYPYVIGGDTKGEGADFYTATVINNVTGNRAATLHMDLTDSKPFTYQLYCLGKFYNDALIAVEINFNTAPIEELQRLNYPNQYVRRKYDDFTKQSENRYGWKTDGNTRPVIIDKEVGYLRDSIRLFNDIPTLREAITFVYDKNGRPDAISGKHDDLLLSDMIAAEIRTQQSFDRQRGASEKAAYTEDMLEDFNNADGELQKYLISKWGMPE
ncbi:MAG: hypothetical protein RR829_00115 [Oscillospiraceae bacterium]